MSLKYRPEIDGLRSIAVGAVIIYHLKLPFGDGIFLSGGFLGVDLFFVISGFLISQIILTELETTKSLSFSRFYARRARRILPPLLLVMLITLPVAWFVLLPSDIIRMGLSQLAALGFVSNFFWYFALGEYGGPSGLVEPFLHTWSLSIEEQFYLVFPLFLFALFRAGKEKLVLPAMGVLLVASLGVSQAHTMLNKEFSFYSPASRAWELLAGGVLAYLSMRRAPVDDATAPLVWRFLPSLGLAVVVVAMWIVALDEVAHPGLVTLPVVLGACAILWGANARDPSIRLLSSQPAVTIGKLSYSLYLWHFPIFALGRIASVDHVAPWEKVLWLVATAVCSVAGYYLVERPFRFRVPTRAFAVSIFGSIGVVAVFAAAMWVSDGTRARLGGLDALYGPAEFDNDALRDASWSILFDLAGDEELDFTNAYLPSDNEASNLWFSGTAALNVLVIGNSHSKDLFNALYLNSGAFDGVEFARFGLQSHFPPHHIEALRNAPNFQNADVVLVAPKWKDAAVENLPGLIAVLQDEGKIVLIAGNTAEFSSDGVYPVYDVFLRTTGALPGLNEDAYAHEDRAPHGYDAALKDIALQTGATFVSRRDIICDDATARCTLATDTGLKTLYDYGHWTLEGARLFGQRIAAADWFRQTEGSDPSAQARQEPVQ